MATDMIGRARMTAALVTLALALAGGAAPVSARVDRGGPALTGLVAAWLSATAQDEPSLRERLFGRGRQEAPAVATFTSQGGPSFVLDQSGPRPMVRFEDSSEIWVLRPRAGVRGDVNYRNDVGDLVLRATRLGGLTLYTPDSPAGLPCAIAAAARPLRPPSHDIRHLLRHFMRESIRAGASIRDNFEITARTVEADASDAFGDAATVAVDGVILASRAPGGRERVSGVRTMQIVAGAGPGVRREGPRLVVTINPRLGPAGRPSSARVARAL